MKPKSDLPIRIRGGMPSDYPFVYNSWLRSYRNASAVEGVGNDIYNAHHHALIEKHLKAPSALLLVACSEEDPKQILGYCLVERRKGALLFHYTYVKQSLRRFGVATELANAVLSEWGDDGPPIVTHRTHLARRILRMRGQDWPYNPYLFWSPTWA